jgi:hypothetical protein
LRLPLLFSFSVRLVSADTGRLVVRVSDPQERPVRGLQIGLKNGGGTATTDDDGKAVIPLAQGTGEHSFVSVQLVSSPRGKELIAREGGEFEPRFLAPNQQFSLTSNGLKSPAAGTFGPWETPFALDQQMASFLHRFEGARIPVLLTVEARS